MLPAADPVIDALEPAARGLVGEIWNRRAVSELKVGTRFAQIAQELGRGRTAPETHAAILAAVIDENGHSELCSQLAARYTGARLAPPMAQAEPLARFGDADEELSLLLHLVLASCISEVTSTFYLRAAMQRARSSLARAALRQLLSDDVRHARIGWEHLASPFVSASQKGHVARALPTLLRLSLEALEDIPERREPFFDDHGCPGRTAGVLAFTSAVNGVILPGMAHVGIDTSPAARWVTEQRWAQKAV